MATFFRQLGDDRKCFRLTLLSDDKAKTIVAGQPPAEFDGQGPTAAQTAAVARAADRFEMHGGRMVAVRDANGIRYPKGNE